MTAVRPPRSWELQTAAVMAAVAAAALFGIVLFVRDLALRDHVLNGGVDGLSPWVAGLVLHGDAFDLLFFVVLIAYIFGFGAWRRETQRMLETIGDTRTPVTVHWTVVAWNLAIALAFMIRLTAEHSGDAAADLTVDAVQNGVRLVGIACLLIGVWQIREQVLLRVTEAGIHLRHDEPRPSSMPVRDLLPAVTGEAPAADEDFWARVARTATGLREDLALLEKTGPLAYRWLLVPADGDLTAVRAELAPGAEITVFLEPPAATETKNYTPFPAEIYQGFLEDEAGALTCQSVTRRRVPAFLARARTARRWALYPHPSPTALTATVARETPVLDR
ncbi:hypothetical protein [Actinoplanes sp. NPDC051411]|uniref:hypothetical protein n=1 Tax=Actinoplanes sp. NPDC051411 TaxID=3155522 RepID=UPI0034269B02